MVFHPMLRESTPTGYMNLHENGLIHSSEYEYDPSFDHGKYIYTYNNFGVDRIWKLHFFYSWENVL